MSDPFAPSSDPDIPTPSRSDLLPHVHGSVRDQLAAGMLDAKHAENEWSGARGIWDERHKEEAVTRQAEEAAKPPDAEPELPIGESQSATLPESQDASSSTRKGPESGALPLGEDGPTGDRSPKNVINIVADSAPPPGDPMAEYLAAERKRQLEAVNRIQPLPPKPLQSRDIEKAVERGIRRAADQASIREGLEEFTRRSGFTPLGDTPLPGPASSEIRESGWRGRFESTKSFFKHLHGILRVLALGLAVGSLTWSWQVLGADEYGVALGLVALFVVFSLVSLYGWAGVPEYPKATKTIKTFLIIGVGIIAVYSAAVVWQKKGDKPWATLWATAARDIPMPAPTSNPLTPAMPSDPAASQRVFVDVKPEYLIGLYKKYNSVQADEAIKTYIGKWIKIPLAVVADVEREKHFGDKPDTIRLAATVDAPNGWVLYSVIATFSDQRWMDRALILNKDEKVTIIGKIHHVIPPGIILEECELVEGKGDESR
jgi:hypothetical protein